MEVEQLSLFDSLDNVSGRLGKNQDRADGLFDNGLSLRVQRLSEGSLFKSSERSDSADKHSRATTKSITLQPACLETIERVLRRLQGSSLLLGALTYALGVKINSLLKVRVRDVRFADMKIVVDRREYSIPETLAEELREHVHQRLCGLEASVNADRRLEPIFVDQARRTLEEVFSESAVSALRLRMSGRVHLRKALRRGKRISSALELFDKGPRIVRRGPGGAITEYYLWRSAVGI